MKFINIRELSTGTSLLSYYSRSSFRLYCARSKSVNRAAGVFPLSEAGNFPYDSILLRPPLRLHRSEAKNPYVTG
ncbi:MAG: hypothetical protein [Olavius algarvensis Gamma 1 endosymbiont]|nr:MAG: hypothetical protein [Olavius algarvensis Gamma 1 endosymbiont]